MGNQRVIKLYIPFIFSVGNLEECPSLLWKNSMSNVVLHIQKGKRCQRNGKQTRRGKLIALSLSWQFFGNIMKMTIRFQARSPNVTDTLLFNLRVVLILMSGQRWYCHFRQLFAFKNFR